MSEPFFGEIRLLPYTFAPQGWAWCNGQQMSISQNPALYSILQTYYGGDARQVFNLPNLKGRAPMHWGNGPGLTPRALGKTSGDATVTLTAQQVANHTHTAQASTATGSQTTPTSSSYPALMNVPATGTTKLIGILGYGAPDTNTTPLAPTALATAGNASGVASHENRQPCLALNFCIAIDGLYPSRN